MEDEADFKASSRGGWHSRKATDPGVASYIDGSARPTVRSAVSDELR